MKKKLPSLIMIFFAVAVWSQKKSENDFSISVNGNKIETTANFKTQVKELKKRTGKQRSKTEYFLLQFNEIPSLIEQQNLEKEGVTLLSYLSNNSYYAAINAEFYNKGSLSKNIRTLTSVDSKFKLDPGVLQNKIPDYALEGNVIKVAVSYFKGVDPKIISRDLESLFLNSNKIDDFFNTVYLQASKDKLEEIAKFNWVQHIELIPAPVESDNVPGLTSHKANVLGSGIPGLGYGLTGKGVKVGVWDGNLEPHKDYTGRVTINEYEYYNEHGEHVSGTIGGAGLLDPRAKGMAPEVQMYGWNFKSSSADGVGSNKLSTQLERVKSIQYDDIEITSNSYGFKNSGGFNTVRYNLEDRGDDLITNLITYLLNIYSNGNDQLSNPGGFNTSTKNSKNALYVAANDPNDSISDYSSFGPTIDGRLVPQIAAVGTDVYSLDYHNSYQRLSGTSMATPGVTGTVALLYERYKNIYNGARPLASLMKALVTNTANDAGNPGPDYKYGFGNINGLRAIKVLDKKMFYSASVANGATYEKDIIVPAGLVSLKVMLAYSDVQGTPGAAAVQVNDLDIKIVKNGTTTLPWILNPITPDANATRGVDNLNNIEQVTLDNPAAGTYKIIVTGTTVPLNSQEFSVVYDYLAPELILTYPIGGEKLNTESTEYIRWDYEGEAKTFTLEYSVDGGVNYTIIAKDIPSTARNFKWKVPAGIVADKVKIRVSAGTKTATSKENFTIITEPKNLVIAPATCGASSYKMDWDPIAGAKYEVLKMNGYAFDIVATVTVPTYTFVNVAVGEDNWFSVRAVDMATGIVSERVRAVNVEPVSQPILSAVNLPFLQDFELRKATNFSLSKGKAGNIKYYNQKVNNAFSYGVKMEGSFVESSSAWIESTTVNAFTNNPDYVKKLTFCNIDATSLAGKKLGMKFNLQWKSVDKTDKTFFRVLVNGAEVKTYEKRTVYGGTVLNGDTELTYDLSAFAGTTFNVVLESVIDNNSITVNNENVYNTLFIDNVSIFEATANILSLTSFAGNIGITSKETVAVKIFNNSPNVLTNVEVGYNINSNNAIYEKVDYTIEPFSEVLYNFKQNADLSAVGSYVINATVARVNGNAFNTNIINKTIYNTGSDVLMGSSPTVTTCSAVFTDSGNRFSNYKDNLTETMTFIPATAGKSIKVAFSTFDLEKNYDYLYVYNGPTDSSPLLGKFSGTALPTSLTSEAAGGELTFKFTTNQSTNRAGWIAAISCVTKPNVKDASVTAIISPEVLGKKSSTYNITINVRNLGTSTLTNHPVYYQVNGGRKFTDVVPVIKPDETVSFTFTDKTDLSTVGATYKIKSGVDIADNNSTNDTIYKIVYNINNLPVHTNTNGYAISRLKWDAVVNTSGATAYSDFKNTKIPVYAGFTYQPEVTVIKPEAPLDKDKTSNVGVFTMIVIDLNGDGNLTDEFYDGKFWINSLKDSKLPIIASTTSIHYFRNKNALDNAGITIPAVTTAGEKLMRVIHMLRKDNEMYNVNLGPIATASALTNSSSDFEVEEYTINVLPFTAANAGIDKIIAPTKLSKEPVTVTASIRNYSNVPISNFPVAYTINGTNEVVENVVGPIAVGASAIFTFAARANLGTPGDYTIDVYTKLPGDTDATNDSKSVTLSHAANSATNVTGTFDGVNDFVKIDATPSLDLSNNYTFEAWVNQKQPSFFGRVIDKGTVLAFVHNTANLTLYKENSLVLSITTPAGSYVINTGLNSIKKNTWQHIAFTVSDTNVYSVYIDGVSVPYTSTGTAAAAVSNVASPAYFGNREDLARGFNGNIDEVRIWSGVLTEVTIAANAMTKYTGNEPALLAYYSFSEGDKQFVFDNSTNDNTAVITNADTDGQGEGKFWNVPVLLKKLEFVNQLSSSYDVVTKTYSVILKDGADIKKVVANFSVEMKSFAKINGTVQVSGVTENDYTNPVTLIVEGVGFNAGISETYTLKVLTGLNNESKLLSYDFKTASNPGLAKEINTDIVGSHATKTVSYGSDLSKLIADFAVSQGAELYIDGVKQVNSKTVVSDYTNDFIVSVVSENKLSQSNYAVSLNASVKSAEASIIAYSVANQVGTSTIDPVSKTVKVLVANNADLMALVPVFQISDFATLYIGNNLQNSGVTTLNYTLPVVYNVKAQNGTVENWTLTIERAKPEITLLGDTVVFLDKGCMYTEVGYTAKDNIDADITSTVVVSGTVDINTPGQYILTYTVKDALQNESSVSRTINVSTVECISEASIIGYSVANQLGASTIDPISKTVKVVVANNANLTGLIPTFQISDLARLRVGANVQNSGVTTLNYTLPVVYNVTAQNGTIENWTVIIERAKPEITLLGDAEVSLDKGCMYTEMGYTAKDNIDADITSAVVVSGTVDINTPGQYILTYTVKDILQNESSVTRTINVSPVECVTLDVPSNTIHGFVIYPNPVKNGKVYVQTSSNSIKNIMIFDMSGKKVFSLQTESKELNVLDLPTGVYIIKVEQEGHTSTQKIIIK